MSVVEIMVYRNRRGECVARVSHGDEKERYRDHHYYNNFEDLLMDIGADMDSGDYGQGE